jgi:hypothetical protein
MLSIQRKSITFIVDQLRTFFQPNASRSVSLIATTQLWETVIPQYGTVRDKRCVLP